MTPRFNAIKTSVALAALGLLAACAPATRVILLPQAEGQPNAVEVRTRQGSQVIDTAYRSVAVNDQGAIRPTESSAEQVSKAYPQLLALMPAAPAKFTLEFVTGGSELTSESQAEVEAILTQAESRPGGEIVVTGHTDSVGDTAGNDALSLQRAQSIRDLFLQRGFAPERVRAEGRGEREPAVPTADNVDEPRNRRAEITIR